ncbi:MAG: hypothetical protein E6686_10255 [Lachnospiraceae bacterium]|nr:hypothetical protein [Lachnospiraceae bacterium]
MSIRGRAWRRKMNYSKRNRKKHIATSAYNWQYKYDGQYIKGKIHCSCPLCSQKTNNRGRYGKAVNYTHSDSIKIESMQCRVLEYENSGNKE